MSSKPLAEKKPSGEKELVRKPLLPIRKKPRVPFASRADSDHLIRYISRSEILIKACLAGYDKPGAQQIFATTVNDSYKFLMTHILRVAKGLEDGKIQVPDRGSRVLLDCYCVAAELYYEYDHALISDGLFDAIGRELASRHDKFMHEWDSPEILLYRKGCFEPAGAFLIHRTDYHKRMAREIAYVLNTGNNIPPPKPRPKIGSGIKIRGA